MYKTLIEELKTSSGLGKRKRSKKELLKLFGIPRLNDSCHKLFEFDGLGRFGNRRSRAIEHSNELDRRVEILEEPFFRNKKILDLGCGSGKNCLDIAKQFSPFKVKGIDLDPILTGRAATLLAEARKCGKDGASEGNSGPDYAEIGLSQNFEEMPMSLRYKLSAHQ